MPRKQYLILRTVTRPGGPVRYKLTAREVLNEKTRENARRCGVTVASRQRILDDLYELSYPTRKDAETVARAAGLEVISYQALAAKAKGARG